MPNKDVEDAVSRLDTEIEKTIQRLLVSMEIVDRLLEVNEKMARTLTELKKLLEQGK